MNRQFFLAGILATVLQPACGSEAGHEQTLAIPTQSEWVDCGRILEAGADGEWDHHLWGGFGLSVIKRNGVYFLYYQGSRAYDEVAGTVAWRAIGVATSADGLRFTKVAANPILTWFPGQNLEEGATSTAPFLDERNRVVLYYGANSWAGGELVNADARIAVSEDAVHFTDVGIALDHADNTIWGARDELFPVVAIRDKAWRIVYYIPNGSLQRGRLGVAWGDSSGLTRSSSAWSANRPIEAWGPGGAARIGPNTFAVFTTPERGSGNRPIEVRTVTTDAPNRMSEVVMSYEWAEVAVATVLLDDDAGKWFLYYRDSSHSGYAVKVALARARERLHQDDPTAVLSIDPPVDVCT
jgi:hypothetical protein